MNLDIQHNPATGALTVQGMTVAKTYAEGVMLAGLLAQCKTNHGAIHGVISQYVEAGLDVSHFPAERRIAAAQATQIREQKEREQKNADFDAMRRKEMAEANDPVALLKKKQAREAREQKIREHGQRIRSSNRSCSSLAVSDWD